MLREGPDRLIRLVVRVLALLCGQCEISPVS